LNVTAAQSASGEVTIAHGDRKSVGRTGLAVIAHLHLEAESSAAIYSRSAKYLCAVTAYRHGTNRRTLDRPILYPVILVGEIAARGSIVGGFRYQPKSSLV